MKATMRTHLSSRRSPVTPSIVLLACLFAVPALRADRQVQTQAKAPADVIAGVKSQVAPDARLAVFDVKAEAQDAGLVVSGEVDSTAARDAVLKALSDAGHPRLVDRVAVLPDPSLAPRLYGVVTVSVAVQKTKPSHGSELGNQLIMGMPVKVLKREGGWYLAQSLDDRYLGWMEPGHLALMTAEEADAFQASRRLVVTALFAVVRDGPREQSGAVSDVVMGNVLRLKGLAHGWYAVQLPDGREGYLPSQAGTSYQPWKASRRATPVNIERIARQFIGVPYLWGGTSPKGFDCSGFTKTTFRANGVELQRDADQQSEQGEPVSLDNDLAGLRKGDLLFFGPRPGVTRITHVGIYLGGKRFIHCATMVKINSFDPAAPDYSDNLLKRLVKAKRLTVG